MTFFEKIICVFTTQKYFNAILSGLKTTVWSLKFSPQRFSKYIFLGTGEKSVFFRTFLKISKLFSPLILIMLIPPTPIGVEIAQIVFSIILLYHKKDLC